MNLRPDSLSFDLLYTNIKARANDNASSRHQILVRDPLPTDLTSSSSSTTRASQSTSSLAASASQSTSFSLSLLRTIKSTPVEVASTREMATRLTTGADARSSSPKEQPVLVSQQAEPSPPPERPAMKTMMKTFRSMTPPQLPPLESEQAMNATPYGRSTYG